MDIPRSFKANENEKNLHTIRVNDYLNKFTTLFDFQLFVAQLLIREEKKSDKKMSSRVLKKLHGEPELDKKEAEEILSDIESEKEKKQINNRYDLVNLCNEWLCCVFRFVFRFVNIGCEIFCFCFCIERLNWKHDGELGLQSKVRSLIIFIFDSMKWLKPLRQMKINPIYRSTSFFPR